MKKFSHDIIERFKPDQQTAKDMGLATNNTWKQNKHKGVKNAVDPDSYALALRNKKERENEIAFVKALSVLASVCPGFNLTEMVIAVYDSALSQFGYEAARKAIEITFATRKSNDPFPSLSQLVEIADPTTRDQLSAEETADKVWNAVARWGWSSGKLAYESMDSLSKKVIDSVGWKWLTEQETISGTTVKAQLRQLATRIIERTRSDQIRDLLYSDKKIQIEEK